MIADFPTSLPATATLEPRLRPVTNDDMSRARDFFLILLTRAVAGDSQGISETVKYPIAVELNPMAMIAGPDEFVANYDRIFNERVLNALSDTDVQDLIYLPEGIRVGQGEIWFNLYCTDPTCVDSEFLITQINN
jgi:hypothetical protein